MCYNSAFAWDLCAFLCRCLGTDVEVQLRLSFPYLETRCHFENVEVVDDFLCHFPSRELDRLGNRYGEN